MDYEKKYKEVLERARKTYQNLKEHSDWIASYHTIEEIFPELAESEDEKNIKGLINELKCSLRAANCQNEACNGGHEKRIALLEWAIAWLEKQGEQKEYTFKSLPRLLDMIEPTSKAKAYCQKLIDTLVKEGYSTDAKIVGEWLMEMNGEKVPMATMDSQKPVEMKTPEESLGINSEKYNKIVDECIFGEQQQPIEVEPFKIEHGKFYYCIKDYYSGVCKRCSKGDVVQALLGMSMMALNEKAFEYFLPVNSIEQKPVEWSEEDEQFLLVCKNALSKYQVSDKWDAGIISQWLENRLKSHYSQKQWKPSEKQLKALKWATCEFHPDCPDTMEQLKYLCTELKSLYYDGN